MQAQILSAALAALLGLGVVAPASAQEHAHHATAVAATPAQAPAQRWATDAPLRKGMADIRVAVQALAHYEMGHMGTEQALAQATAIEQSIGDIVANCKLDPQADAVLHGIIAKLAQGTAALKADPKDMAAIATLRAALQDYSRLFDDPDWKTDTTAAD